MRLPQAVSALLTSGLLGVSALVCAAPPVPRDANLCDRPSPLKSERSTSVTWENDSLEPSPQSDEYYTQGMQLAYTFEVPDSASGQANPQNWSLAHRALEHLGSTLCRHRLGALEGADSRPSYRSESLIFGQHMFTPGDIGLRRPYKDDRPYAAWLYVGTRLESIVASDSYAWTHEWEIQAGTVGPPAQGEWVQSHFHRLIGARRPQGWSYQIPAEPGLFVSYRVTGRNKPLGGKIIAADFLPYGQIALGNIQTYAEGGLKFRVGRNLGDPLHTLSPTFAAQDERQDNQRSFAATGQHIPTTAPPDWLDTDSGEYCLAGLGAFSIKECSINLGVSGRAVARNIFLDGTWFSDSPSVHKEPGYYDVYAGFRLRWSGFMLDYEFTRRSREFSPVPLTGQNRDGHHNYGSLTGKCYGEQALWCPLVIGGLLIAMAFQ